MGHVYVRYGHAQYLEWQVDVVDLSRAKIHVAVPCHSLAIHHLLNQVGGFCPHSDWNA